MAHTQCLITLFMSYLLLVDQVSARYAHGMQQIERRQSEIRPYNGPPGVDTDTLKQVLTLITQSPGGPIIAITSQSQIVTSYVPQFTLCELAPVAQVLATPIPTTTSAPYKNYTASIPSGNGTCTTIYSPTITQVCATVLTGLADKYTVTACNQEITFSTNYGFELVTGIPTVTTIQVNETSNSLPGLNATSDLPGSVPMLATSVSLVSTPSVSLINSPSLPLVSPPSLSNGPAISVNALGSPVSPPHNSLIHRRDLTSTITPPPSIVTLTTYLIAPWQQLTSAAPPSDVDKKICATFPNGTSNCILEYYNWITSLATIIRTTTTSVNLSTTISGPSQVVVESLVANITDTITTFSLVTSLALEYETVAEVTATSTRSALSTGPTVFETFTLLQASSTALSSTLPTSTTTLKLTRTFYVSGTTTITISNAIKTLAPGVTSLDAASALGIH